VAAATARKDVDERSRPVRDRRLLDHDARPERLVESDVGAQHGGVLRRRLERGYTTVRTGEPRELKREDADVRAGVDANGTSPDETPQGGDHLRLVLLIDDEELEARREAEPKPGEAASGLPRAAPKPAPQQAACRSDAVAERHRPRS